VGGSRQQDIYELSNGTPAEVLDSVMSDFNSFFHSESILAGWTTEASTGGSKKSSTESEWVKKLWCLRSRTESTDEDDVKAPWQERLAFCRTHKEPMRYVEVYKRQERAKLQDSEFIRCQHCHTWMPLLPNKQSNKCAGCVEMERRLEFRMRPRAQRSRIPTKQVH